MIEALKGAEDGESIDIMANKEKAKELREGRGSKNQGRPGITK